MSTKLRATIAKSNPYWISKHRYYELKHFCLQYKEIKEMYISTLDRSKEGILISNTPEWSDPTSDISARREFLKRKLDSIENSANCTDEYLAKYILKGVTEGKSYTYLRTFMEMPCGKDKYYDLRRKFFWILDKVRT